MWTIRYLVCFDAARIPKKGRIDSRARGADLEKIGAGGAPERLPDMVNAALRLGRRARYQLR